MRKVLFVMTLGVGILAMAGLAVAANNQQVLNAAAMNGTTYGLKTNIELGSLTEAYVQSDHPNQESHFKASFYLDATGLNLPVSPSENKCFVFLKLYRDTPTPTQHSFVYICRNNADNAWRIAVNTRKDNTFWNWMGSTFLSGVAAPNPHLIEIEWQQASGPSSADGVFRLWRDGVLRLEDTTIQNYTWNVSRVRVGVPNDAKLGPLASGYFYFDEYVSTR